MDIRDKKFVQEFKKERRNDAILKLIRIVLLFITILLQIIYAADYYDMLHSRVGHDSELMMLLIVPYVTVGVAFTIRFLIEIFDVDYTFRAYRASLLRK